MKTTSKITNEVNKTLDALDHIQEVKVSPFFKNKVLNAIDQQKETKQPFYSWFNPQLQLATLALIVCMNATVIYYCLSVQNSQQDISSFESFIQDYNLDSGNSITLN